MNEHRGILNRLQWMQEAYGLTSEDRVLQKTPFSFDVSVWELFWPLMFGATLIVARPEGHKDPAYLVSLLDEQRITTLHFVPSMLTAFLDELDHASARTRCASLQRVFASGEALLPAMVDGFAARLPNAALHNLYGPTERSVLGDRLDFHATYVEPARILRKSGGSHSSVSTRIRDQHRTGRSCRRRPRPPRRRRAEENLALGLSGSGSL